MSDLKMSLQRLEDDMSMTELIEFKAILLPVCLRVEDILSVNGRIPTEEEKEKYKEYLIDYIEENEFTCYDKYPKGIIYERWFVKALGLSKQVLSSGWIHNYNWIYSLIITRFWNKDSRTFITPQKDFITPLFIANWDRFFLLKHIPSNIDFKNKVWREEIPWQEV